MQPRVRLVHVKGMDQSLSFVIEIYLVVVIVLAVCTRSESFACRAPHPYPNVSGLLGGLLELHRDLHLPLRKTMVEIGLDALDDIHGVADLAKASRHG